MNKYAILAQEHWKKVAPARYRELENPVEYFTDLGDQVLAQISAILDQTERKVDPDLPYLEKVGTLNALRRQAEEVVLTDLVYSVPIENSLMEELDQMLGCLPSDSMLSEILSKVTIEAEADWGEQEGWTEELEATRDQALALMPLVTEQFGCRVDQLEMLTETQTQEWLQKLAPFYDPLTQTLVRV